HMNFNIIFGAWMEGEFKLEILALGSITGILGFAYLSGQGLVAAISDRIGLRTALSGGIAVSILAALILPLASKHLLGALIILFLFYFLFEFSYVSNLALMTEMIPGSRATMLSLVMAGAYLGMGFASWLGPALFKYGILANSLFAAGLNLIALGLMLRYMRK
ncbi:MAG: MFS transporter, partial [Anaerolineales bacterium]|nr:MFS transporter [Anaerolineales bacterium]